MSRLVVLKLGHGNWQQGLPTVIAQVWEAEGATPMQLSGSLPSAPELASLYQQWRSLYEAFYHPLCGHHASTRSGIEIEEEGVTHVSRAKFDQLSQQLKHQLDDWLNASSFSKVERRLRTKLSPLDEIRVIVETDDRQLRRFPWHLWSFFDDYPQAEVALSAPEYKQVSFSRPASANQVRILAVLGNSQGIDIQQDRILLEQLPYVKTTFLVEPQRQTLDQQLWDQQGWDIFFFAGHSTSQADGELGEMVLNQTDSLTITHLKNALTAAIARGLKIAIFNSCDGLGLARDMADLNIPQLVVMREPVPDRVAQEFLKHLLTAFSTGQSFYQSVREAREKLQGLEDDYPCASWLPVICQNPAETPIDWQSLLGKANPALGEPLKSEAACIQSSGRSRSWKNLRVGLATSILTTTIVMGIRFLGALQSVELKAFDALMRQRPPEGPDPRILVVEVTEEDTNQHGYPLEDQTLAVLIEKLQQYSPQAIGIDMHRHQPQGQGRASLMAQFQKYPNLFTVCSFGSQDINRAPPREFSETQQINQMGFSDLVVDDQDIIRRQLLSYDPSLAASPSACTTPYSLGFQLAFRFLYVTGIQPLNVNANQEWQFGSVPFKRLSTHFGGYQNLNGLSS
ncbi:MAG TPA: CHASE2 domain-containing protein, partial [Candidatus Obscuribacterales bacterium]